MRENKILEPSSGLMGTRLKTAKLILVIIIRTDISKKD